MKIGLGYNGSNKACWSLTRRLGIEKLGSRINLRSLDRKLIGFRRNWRREMQRLAYAYGNSKMCLKTYCWIFET